MPPQVISFDQRSVSPKMYQTGNPAETDKPVDSQIHGFETHREYNVLQLPPDQLQALFKDVIPSLVDNRKRCEVQVLGNDNGDSSLPKVSAIFSTYDAIGRNNITRQIDVIHPYNRETDLPPMAFMHSAFLDEVARAYGDEKLIMCLSMTTAQQVPRRDSKFLPTISLITVGEDGQATPRGWFRTREDEINPLVPAEGTGRYVGGDSIKEGIVIDMGPILTKIANAVKQGEDEKSTLTCQINLHSLSTAKLSSGAGVNIDLVVDTSNGMDVPGSRSLYQTRTVLVEDRTLANKE